MRRPLEISIIKPAWKISPDRAVPPGVGFTVVTRPFCVSGVSEMSNTICFMHFSYLLPSARNRRLSVRRAARHERHIKCCYFEPKRLLFHTTLRAFNCPRLLLPPSRLPPPGPLRDRDVPPKPPTPMSGQRRKQNVTIGKLSMPLYPAAPSLASAVSGYHGDTGTRGW